jgi:dihydroflavonol-4-reductase
LNVCERGDRVICIAKDRLNATALDPTGITLVLADLNNGIGRDAILGGIDCIYHVTGVTRARSASDYYAGNYLATKRLVDNCAARCQTLKRFVHISSLAAVGPSLDGMPVTEGVPYNPVSHYGRSKMLGELEVPKASDKLPITIVRPPAVYGPREQDLYEYMKMILRGIQPLIGFERKFLNLIHVDDLVRGVLLAGGHPRAEGETYFIGSETDHSTEEIGRVIAWTLRRTAISVSVPHAMVYAVGAISEVVARVCGSPVFFNLQKAKESVQRAWICSIDKAKQQLGFRQQISLDEGIRETYR